MLNKITGIDVFHLDCGITIIAYHLKDFGNTDILILNFRGRNLLIGLIDKAWHITCVMCTLVNAQIIVLVDDNNVTP